MGRKGGLVRYVMEFSKPSGCDPDLIMDMARHDSASVINMERDGDCQGRNVRRVTMEGRYAPSIARWHALSVGAREI